MSWDEFESVNEQPAPSQQSYPKKSYGGYPKKEGGFQGKGNWKPQEDNGPIELYLPIVFVSNPDMPETIKPTLEGIAKRLNEAGYTLRIGGNKGLEELFETQMQRVEVHVPWKGFNEKESKFAFFKPGGTRAFEISKLFSPVYDKLPDAVKTFLARNVQMIMGKKLNGPALALIVWTADGCESARDRSIKTGNSGHVIAMASAMRIPIFNLSKPDALERLKKYLES